jgi:hypothetical protein
VVPAGAEGDGGGGGAFFARRFGGFRGLRLDCFFMAFPCIRDGANAQQEGARAHLPRVLTGVMLYHPGGGRI